MVNILIAIVTSEYEKAREQSCMLFARARLEMAARHGEKCLVLCYTLLPAAFSTLRQFDSQHLIFCSHTHTLSIVARDKIMNPPDDSTSGLGRKLWRLMGRLKYLLLIGAVEYFLIKSLISATFLWRENILGDFLYISLILCAILHHMFVVASHMYVIARCICNWESLRWLRGTRLHSGMLKYALKPVCNYLSSVGLGKGESCPDASDTMEKDHPLSRNEYMGKQMELESQIQESIRASEIRILHAVKSMMMFSSSAQSPEL